MTRKKIIILLVVFFLPFFLTYFFLSAKAKEKEKDNILGNIKKELKNIVGKTTKEKVLPTPKITTSLTVRPTATVTQIPNEESEELLTPTVTPTTFPRLNVGDINLPTPTPTVKIIRAYIISPTPTPTIPVTLSRLTVNPKTYSVDISFITSRSCSSQIFYGEQRNPSIAVLRNQPTTNHSYTISNLEEGTTYYFKIKLFPSFTSGTLLYESQVNSFQTNEAKRFRLTLQTIQVLKDGNSSGPGNFRLYLGIRDPSHPDLVTCCGFLNSFTASDNETISLNRTFHGGGAQHGTPLTVFLDEDSQADPGMLHFSFDAPLSGPNQDYTKTVTSQEKNGKKFKATFRIEIFDN